MLAPMSKPGCKISLDQECATERKTPSRVTELVTMLGVALNFSPINPIKALYWSAVINGVVAVPTQPFLLGTIGRHN
jgi:hypothetical protein